jgi:hypothetical protein
VVFNGGVLRGKNSGVSRLFRDCFSPHLAGKKISPIPGIQSDIEQQQETIASTSQEKNRLGKLYIKFSSASINEAFSKLAN